MNKTLLVVVALGGLSAPAWAEGSGDVFRGKAYSQAMCASCHALTADGAASPNPAARPFRTINLTYPSGEAFAAWLNTKHPAIPNSLINARQAEDITAYVANLKGAPAD